MPAWVQVNVYLLYPSMFAGDCACADAHRLISFLENKGVLGEAFQMDSKHPHTHCTNIDNLELCCLIFKNIPDGSVAAANSIPGKDLKC